MRTHEAFDLYTLPCVSDQVRKRNRLLAGTFPSLRYTLYNSVCTQQGTPAARLHALLSQNTGHTPRKLPRKHEQSSASTHCLLSQAFMCDGIAIGKVKQFLQVFPIIFVEFLCEKPATRYGVFPHFQIQIFGFLCYHFSRKRRFTIMESVKSLKLYFAPLEGITYPQYRDVHFRIFGGVRVFSS